MRIISGKFRGRKIIGPKNNLIRPTSDRAREMIFSTLNSILSKHNISLNGLVVMDCFCGTGAFGIEAISRGAEKVVFIDYSAECLDVCKSNCNKFQINEKSKIFKIDFFKEKIAEQFFKIDILFCDPPYRKFNLSKIIQRIDKLVKKHCFIIIESQIEDYKNELDGYELIKIKYISNSQFIFLKKG